MQDLALGVEEDVDDEALFASLQGALGAAADEVAEARHRSHAFHARMHACTRSSATALRSHSRAPPAPWQARELPLAPLPEWPPMEVDEMALRFEESRADV